MGEMVLGYDAAKHYQGELDYVALKAKGGKYIITKAGEGWLDYNAYDYVVSAKAAGMITGTYWYYRQVVSINGKDVWCEPKRQAQEYWDATKGKFDLPPALDIENAGNPYFRQEDVLTCLREIERLFGRKPIIYTGKYIWENNVRSPSWSTGYSLWLAQYRDTSLISLPKPFEVWAIHQFSDSIKVGGTTIDHDYFNGNEAELEAFASGAEAPTTEPSNKVIVTCGWLRIRPEAKYIEGIKTFVAEKGQILQKAGEVIIEKTNSYIINWLPVFSPVEYLNTSGQPCNGIGYVSYNSKYVSDI